MPKQEPEGFKEFWEGVWRPHARHTDGRGIARETFAKLVKNGADPQDIVDGAKCFFRTMKDRDRDYVPLASTWLNRGAFEDLAEQERAYEARRQERLRAQSDNVVPISEQIPAERRAEIAALGRARVAGVKMGA